MKYFVCFVMVLTITYGLYAQKKVVKNIEKNVQKTELEFHFYFLASDEMRGRNTGTIENEIAARYIAERFRSYGVKMAPGMDSYFQPVSLVKEVTPIKAELKVGDSTFVLEEDMVFYSSTNGDFEGEIVYVGYGLEEDLEGFDLEGKLVVAKAGNGNPNERFTPYTIKKQRLIAEAGGLGLVELYKPSRYPWKMIVYYFSGEKFKLDKGDKKKSSLPSAWLYDKEGSLLTFFEEMSGQEGLLTVSGNVNKKITVPNVVGYIEGTDPKLKDEYILISAHFDHLGVSPNDGDSIWNGARDNGIGVANMLTAAEYLVKNPPKRSVAFLACNAEEKGLFGSRWYADHPIIPLNKTIFNLNADTGGYNDVTKVTVVGFNRTSITSLLSQASDAFGLLAIDDPLPEKNFYDRSDNVSFAAKGVPAVSFGPGYTEMNEEITKYYHQPTDEPNTLDYEYLTKYTKAYIYAVTLIGNYGGKIFWTPGDKYEKAGKQLYGVK